MPYLEVSTAAHRGESLDDNPDLSGESVPFSDERLPGALSGPRHLRRTRFDAAVDAAVAAGFVLPRDAGLLVTRARAAPVPSDRSA